MAKKKQENQHKKTETHQFEAETGKILQLMIHSLYAHKDIFLRELISNASDACDKRRYMAITKPELLEGEEKLTIHIEADETKKTLTIKDNGIGMDKQELIDNLGTIAKSGTQRFLEEAQKNKENAFNLIGQFGVGFYSAFMVADTVTVLSRKIGQEQAFIWQSQGTGSFTIDSTDQQTAYGTTIILSMKESEKEFLEKHRLKHIIKTYSDHISFPIELKAGKEAAENVSEGAALWTKDKKDISTTQYEEFYKHTAHAGDTPWLTLHNKAEGIIEYTSLLFIPSQRPFDMFHPDRHTRIKLYVKKVFISENIDILPRYLRFMRGIIDSQDLPLNISRETLQHNTIIAKIKKAVSKKIISELQNKAQNDKEAFAIFWQNFGAVLKEGLCEAGDANREALLELCHFQTTQSDTLTNLDQYITNMGKDQDKIYYLTGDNINTLKKSPQLEAFLQQGIEVILLTDPVDDFWVNVNHDYKGKELVSITRSDINLNKDKKDTAEKEEKTTSTDHKALLDFMKECLKDKVTEVTISKKLADSPVCLSVKEGAMDIRMERFLLSQNQLAAATPKVLEINPNHTIITYIEKNIGSDTATHLTKLLFDQACILEGEPVWDASEFAQLLNQLLEKTL